MGLKDFWPLPQRVNGLLLINQLRLKLLPFKRLQKERILDTFEFSKILQVYRYAGNYSYANRAMRKSNWNKGNKNFKILNLYF